MTAADPARQFDCLHWRAHWVRNAIAAYPDAATEDRRIGRDGSPLTIGPAIGRPATSGQCDLVGLYDFSTTPTQHRGDS